ncbi:hypothetical protein EYF80_049303 [Liparis tanakae]|uniref:Uncharacterized protein n=1 Tax=Liparis tanakae TaxID=230148 RepID=A0A4Z2FHX4_9TELE|nr:hypothetical protein EYF80_049303 [Liparis tanakae]
MDRGYMLRAMPMSVTARFTVSSSGALSAAARRAALTRTAIFPVTDRRAAGRTGRGAIKQPPREKPDASGAFVTPGTPELLTPVGMAPVDAAPPAAPSYTFPVRDIFAPLCV